MKYYSVQDVDGGYWIDHIGIPNKLADFFEAELKTAGIQFINGNKAWNLPDKRSIKQFANRRGPATKEDKNL